MADIIRGPYSKALLIKKGETLHFKWCHVFLVENVENAPNLY